MKNNTKIISTIPQAQLIIEALKTYGIQQIVVSPGSRNAPLTISIAEDSYFDYEIVVDERVAAFVAMGKSMASGKPTAVLCTSGTAVLNYHPAVAEAFYQKIPLLVLSADRPTHMVDQFEGQTIRQQKVLQNHTVTSVSLSEKNQKSNVGKINSALQSMLVEKRPVHINIPFSEPLYGLQKVLNSTFKKDKHKNIDRVFGAEKLWKKGQKVLFLMGQHYPKNGQKQFFQNLPNNVVVLSETISNCKNKYTIEHIDRCISDFTEKDKEKYRCDVLITVGQNVISKRIKQFFRNYPPKTHIHVDDVFPEVNTFGCLTRGLKYNLSEFSEYILSQQTSANKGYFGLWEDLKKTKKELHKTFLKTLVFSDFWVVNMIQENVGNSTILQWGNSSVIRYVQLMNWSKKAKHYANRGTSGIDGSTSTAVGFAKNIKERVLFTTGDLSFLYDTNGLWNEKLPDNLKIIVINNGGGAIFSILPDPKKTTNFERNFLARQNNSIEGVVKSKGLDYFYAKNRQQVKIQWSKFLENKGCSVLEIDTSKVTNDEVLKSYFNCLKRNKK